MLLSVSSSDCSFVFAIRAPASVIYTLSLHDALPISFASAVALLAVTTLWNVGLMFQWGSHLIPARGPVSFSEIAHNQFFVVPRQLSADLQRYLFKRKALMQQIEDRDLQQLKNNPPPP